MSVDDTSQSVEADDIFHQVRRQLRREQLAPGRGSAVRFYSGPVRSWRAGRPEADALRDAQGSEEMAERLQALFTSLDSNFAASMARIGEMPPVASTLRGFAGRMCIGMLQRLLWWYTRSIHRFAESVGAHLQDSTEAIESLACSQEAARIEVASLRVEYAELRDELRRLRESSPGGTGGVR